VAQQQQQEELDSKQEQEATVAEADGQHLVGLLCAAADILAKEDAEALPVGDTNGEMRDRIS
jgi:hypothetical protein